MPHILEDFCRTCALFTKSFIDLGPESVSKSHAKTSVIQGETIGIEYLELSTSGKAFEPGEAISWDRLHFLAPEKTFHWNSKAVSNSRVNTSISAKSGVRYELFSVFSTLEEHSNGVASSQKLVTYIDYEWKGY